MAQRDQRCRMRSSHSAAVRHEGRALGLSSAQTMAPSIAQWYSALIAPDDGDGQQPEQQPKELQERQLQVATDLMRSALTLLVSVQKTQRRQRRSPGRMLQNGHPSRED